MPPLLLVFRLSQASERLQMGLLSTPLFGLKEPQMLSPLLLELGAEKRKRTRIGNTHEYEP